MRFNKTAADILADTKGAAGNEEVPSDYNGSAGNVDLAKPADYTEEEGKILVSGTARSGDIKFDLKETAVYRLWLIQGKPTAAKEVTAEEAEMFYEVFCKLIARVRIYAAMSKANIPVFFRKSDIIDDSYATDIPKKPTFVKKMYNLILDTLEYENQVADAGQMILYSLVANASHRIIFEDHSWFTEDGKRESTVTGSLVKVAGRLKSKFSKFMNVDGHDGNHHLATDSIVAFASALCERATSAEISDDWNYKNENQKGKKIYDIFKLADSATDRFPPGTLGKAALINGLEYAQAMINHISGFILVKNTRNIINGLSVLHHAVQNDNVTRENAKELENQFADVFSMVVGYCEVHDLIPEGRAVALRNHSDRKPAAKAIGISLGQVVAKTHVHEKAAEGNLLATLAAFDSALQTTASLPVGHKGNVPGASAYVSGDAPTAQVGKSPMETAMMFSKGGDAFFDAQA